MSSDSLIGTIVNEKYRIDALIGEGGMGRVFRVTHQELNKTFALKLMKVGATKSSSGGKSRFRREASALAKLDHPNIVAIVDFGIMKSSQLPFIVMEYIDGITLRKLLNNKGTLGESQAIYITKQLCLALHEAHIQGIIHRDLKPENIIIRQTDDEIKVSVVDFGIAKLMDNELSAVDNESITTGNAPGTLRYIAPEQFFKLPIDARVDVFSICLILYEMLTGEVPPVMVGAFKSLSEMRPGVTPQLSELVGRGLSQSPNDRPESVLALKKVLDTIERSTNIDPPTVKTKLLPRPSQQSKTVTDNSLTRLPLNTETLEVGKSGWRYWGGVGVMLLLIMGGIGIYQFYQSLPTPTPKPIVTPSLSFIAIKGGVFFMGSNTGDPYSRPSHQVVVKPFRVAKSLVTNSQYAQFVKAEDYSPPTHWKGKEPAPYILEEPVTNISWNDAVAFCRWLSKQHNQRYRLLTEAEWEYLARNSSLFGISEIATDYLEWTSSELALYEGATVKLSETLSQTPTIVLRGKDEKVGKDPLSDRMWQEKRYSDAKLGFRLAQDTEQ